MPSHSLAELGPCPPTQLREFFASTYICRSAEPLGAEVDLVQLGVIAEQLGFDSVWTFDHLSTPTEVRSSAPHARNGKYRNSATMTAMTEPSKRVNCA